MNQTKKIKIKGQIQEYLDLVSKELIKSTGKRKNNPENQGEYYELLKESIKENGVLKPIIVDIENNQVISGKLRLQIAHELGCQNILIVYEKLERANKINDFYNQPNPKSPMQESYINQFIADLQRITSNNIPEAEELFQTLAKTINHICMSEKNALYAFDALLNNIHIDSLKEFLHTGIIPTTLHGDYINEFVTVLQSNFENLSQIGIQILEDVAILIFELCMCGEGMFIAIDNLISNIYWVRIVD